MTLRLWCGVLVYLLPAGAQVREAAAKAISLLQQADKTFYKSQTCFSCHHQGLPMLTYELARERGVPVDESAALASSQKAFAPLKSIDAAVQASYIIDPSMSDGFYVISAHASGVAPSLTTAIYARRLANWQEPDGHWYTIDQRPPQSHSAVTATAISIRALQLHMPRRLRKETDERIGRAREWLRKVEPRTTTDHASRLTGLKWAGATERDLTAAAQRLLALQKPDGGWPQLPWRQSDAYATGEALVALHRAGGIATSHASWQRGLRYLLDTQKSDGSWQVPTRMVSPASVSPPYFETQFPYGKDQFISAAGTSWATMALMLTLPKTLGARPLPVPEVEPAGAAPWMETAVFGSASELKKLLDGGLDPNSKTTAGTTVLMMASADAAKVRLLIERGADVTAKSKSGFTALMTASVYRGTSAAVRLLLDKGAEAGPAKGVLFNASPLFFAAFAGDRDNIALLRGKGADVGRRMLLLGQFEASPIQVATFTGNAGMIQALLGHGANPSDKDSDEMTVLHWAVLGNRPEAVRALIAGGAKVDAADRFGYTPLHYAATIDFGDTEVVETLLKAGANSRLKTKDGKTPLEQAAHWNHPRLRKALEGSAR